MSGIGRREFVALLGGAAAAWPHGVRARQRAVRPLVFSPCYARAHSASDLGVPTDAAQRGVPLFLVSLIIHVIRFAKLIKLWAFMLRSWMIDVGVAYAPAARSIDLAGSPEMPARGGD